MYTLRRPLIVSELPLDDEIDVRIAKLVGVPWSLHAFERISLIPSTVADLAYGLGAWASATMLARFAPHDRIVLLGDEARRAFELDLAPLAMIRVQGRAYLYLPNPWPDDTEASLALQGFLDSPKESAPRCGVG